MANPSGDMPTLNGVTAFEPCSDVANGQRIATVFGSQLLYVDGIGWHLWGSPWKYDELGARAIVHGLGKVIALEAAKLACWAAKAKSSAVRKEREAASQARFKWARKSELSSSLEAALKCAKPYLTARAAEMDADPDLLGGIDSVLDLQTGLYRPYEPADRITKTLGLAFDHLAACPVWERFVSQVFAEDAELVGWFQRFMGYCLSGRRSEHLLPIFWGSGGNGKST